MKKKIPLLILLSSLFVLHSHGQQGQWTWMNGSNTPNSTGHFGTQGVFDALNSPPALYEPCEWTDLNGNFWLYGGVRIGGPTVELDALWEFKPSINQWAWIKGNNNLLMGQPNFGTQGVPSPTNTPGGAGYASSTWVDTTGNLWLFIGVGEGGGDNNDLWKYEISTNEWTWMKGGTSIYGHYGTRGIEDSANFPGARYETNASWTDGHNLWLFGGMVYSVNGIVPFNDLWKYNINTNQWTWMKGDTIFPTAHYGIKGIPDSLNNPPPSCSYAKWKDYNNLWLYIKGTSGSEVWKYNIQSNDWTWIVGDTILTTPVVSTRCVSSENFVPKGRWENRACWKRDCEDVAFFGGLVDGNSAHCYNDLWNYNFISNQWTWMSGDTAFNALGVYGTRTIANPNNKPGSRGGSIGWKDSNGYLWMFGGCGINFNSIFNDMWRFIPDTTCPHLSHLGDSIVTSFTASPLTGCAPLTVIFNNTSTNNASFHWNFGDGQTSDAFNPTHIYTMAGTYTVTLIGSNSCLVSSDTTIKVGYITVLTSAYAAFVPIGPLTGCDSLTVTFINGCANTSSYLWDFGDGNTTNAIGPTHTYSSPGSYTVSLIGYNADGCNDTAIHNQTITIISPQSVSSSFTIDTTIGCKPLLVNFTNHSTNATSYHWDFGDGGTSTLTNPSHYYSYSGYFSVTLIAYDSTVCGIYSDTSVQTFYYTIFIPPATPVITQHGDTLISSFVTGNQWFNVPIAIPNATNQQYIVLVNGCYAVQETDTNGCKSISDTICFTTGIPQLNPKQNQIIIIYPNPFSTSTTLTLQGSYHSPTLFIYNLMGQEVITITIGNNKQITINRNNIPAGIYFYKVIEANKEVLGIGKMVVVD